MCLLSYSEDTPSNETTLSNHAKLTGDACFHPHEHRNKRTSKPPDEEAALSYRSGHTEDLPDG